MGFFNIFKHKKHKKQKKENFKEDEEEENEVIKEYEKEEEAYYRGINKDEKRFLSVINPIIKKYKGKKKIPQFAIEDLDNEEKLKEIEKIEPYTKELIEKMKKQKENYFEIEPFKEREVDTGFMAKMQEVVDRLNILEEEEKIKWEKKKEKIEEFKKRKEGDIK